MGVNREDLLFNIMKDGVFRTISMMQITLINRYGQGMWDSHVTNWIETFDDPLYRLVVHEIGPDYHEYRLVRIKDTPRQSNFI